MEKRMYLLVLWMLCLVWMADATPVFFPDAEATSANGRYLVTGRSAENRKRNPEPFQSDFTFELLDRQTKIKLWTFRTGEEGEPGGLLFVDNEGTVIRQGGRDTLWLIRPTGKAIELVDNLLEALPKAEVEAYCDDTTAGIFWDQFSFRDFLEIGGRNYFVIRTYWGRYFVVDLEKGAVVGDKNVKAEIEAELLRRARLVIAKKREELWEPCDGCGGKHPSREVACFLMILEKHQVDERKWIIDALREEKDDHMHDVLEHLERLRKRKP